MPTGLPRVCLDTCYVIASALLKPQSMKASDLRQRYLDFFSKKHGHAVIHGASLLPENDPTVLFTTAGMHPLIPYLLGESHPEGTQLVGVQGCLRTVDIDGVGDNTHMTFFEMLGNWSLGDYFKEKSIKMSYEFMTSSLEERGLGLNPDRLAVTVFEGDENCPFDEEACKAWEALGFIKTEKATPDQKRRIFTYNKKENWWGPAGLTGPCGPDSEIFYYNSDETDKMWDTEPSDDVTPWVEIWNNVFMQYNKDEEGNLTELEQQNVDTGMGLERVTAIMQGKSSAYETELFTGSIDLIRDLASQSDQTSERVVADHLRAATFLLGDERSVTPSNNDQGYVLRKLIRRAIRHGRKLGIKGNFTTNIAEIYIELYSDFYKGLEKNKTRILTELQKEEEKFQKALTNGEAEIDKDIEKVTEGLNGLASSSKLVDLEMGLNAVSQIVNSAEALKTFNQALRPLIGKTRGQHKAAASEMDLEVTSEVREMAKKLQTEGWQLRGDRAFYYFETHGFPFEMTQEILSEKNIKIDEVAFNKAFEKHQEKSRAGAEQKFVGGLADHSDDTKKLHTATHLMLEALRQVLGTHVEQKGSNITAERLRFDFNHDDKLTPEQIVEVEKIVNDAIQADYQISYKEMTVKEAKEANATGVFVDKYAGELDGKVKVYSMGDFSKEICGGPHVDSTGQLGSEFKILKEQSSSSGIRRIRAVLS
jgi:alanyl-tRNA synthetase